MRNIKIEACSHVTCLGKQRAQDKSTLIGRRSIVAGLAMTSSISIDHGLSYYSPAHIGLWSQPLTHEHSDYTSKRISRLSTASDGDVINDLVEQHQTTAATLHRRCPLRRHHELSHDVAEPFPRPQGHASSRMPSHEQQQPPTRPAPTGNNNNSTAPSTPSPSRAASPQSRSTTSTMEAFCVSLTQKSPERKRRIPWFSRSRARSRSSARRRIET